MGWWGRFDRDRSHLDTIGSLDVEGTVGAERRTWKLTVATANCEVAARVRHRQARAVSGPSASREWPAVRSRGITLTGRGDAAHGERHNELQRLQAPHDLQMTTAASEIEIPRLRTTAGSTAQAQVFLAPVPARLASAS
jgi:hypothetical protein